MKEGTKSTCRQMKMKTVTKAYEIQKKKKKKKKSVLKEVYGNKSQPQRRRIISNKQKYTYNKIN